MSADSSAKLSTQAARYLVVGAFNTLFGYATFAAVLFILTRTLPDRWLAAKAIAAALIAHPVNITVAWLGYKHFVFRTRGNHLREWLKAVAVYGTGMLPGLLALGALTRLFQSLPPHWTWPRTHAAYIAGALTTAFTAAYSFFAHRHVTFRGARAANPPHPPPSA